jgi:hypothetical protein
MWGRRESRHHRRLGHRPAAAIDGAASQLLLTWRCCLATVTSMAPLIVGTWPMLQACLQGPRTAEKQHAASIGCTLQRRDAAATANYRLATATDVEQQPLLRHATARDPCCCRCCCCCCCCWRCPAAAAAHAGAARLLLLQPCCSLAAALLQPCRCGCRCRCPRRSPAATPAGAPLQPPHPRPSSCHQPGPALQAATAAAWQPPRCYMELLLLLLLLLLPHSCPTAALQLPPRWPRHCCRCFATAAKVSVPHCADATAVAACCCH